MLLGCEVEHGITSFSQLSLTQGLSKANSTSTSTIKAKNVPFEDKDK